MIDQVALDSTYNNMNQTTPAPKIGPGPKAAPVSADDISKGYNEQFAPDAKPTLALDALSDVDTKSSDADKFFGDTGVPDPTLSGVPNDVAMANRQSFGDKLGRRLIKIVPNVAAGIVDMVGNVASLASQWGDNRTYSNSLNDLADNIRSGADDIVGKVYHKSTDTWAMSDPAWWIDHIGGLAEMGIQFAVGGYGAAKILGAGAEALAGVEDLSQAGKLTQAAVQLGTSGLVSYTMGAQGGANVYKQVYQNQLQKGLASGLDPDKAVANAQHIAAQSAATTAQLTTMLTMGMNVSSFAPFFRNPENIAQDIIGKRLAAESDAGASMGEQATAIRGMDANDYVDKLYHHQSIGSKLAEMGKMGVENTLISFAEKTGTDIGDKGKTRGFVDQLGEVENVLDRMGNSEGLLAFAMGAGMGGVQHYLTHNIIPSRSIDKLAPDGTPIQATNSDGTEKMDDNGKPVIAKQWVTPRAMEKDFVKNKFATVKEAVASDLDNFQRLQDNYIAASKAGNPIDMAEAKDQMFDVGALNAVRMGMGEPWIKTFQGIANMDNKADVNYPQFKAQLDDIDTKLNQTSEPKSVKVLQDQRAKLVSDYNSTGTQTEAMKAGYAETAGDETYKDKANEAIENINKLTSIRKSLLQKYGNGGGTDAFIDMAFARHADLNSINDRITKFSKQLDGMDKDLNPLADLSDPLAANKLLQDYNKKNQSYGKVTDQLAADSKTLVKAHNEGDKPTMDKLFRKYRAVGFGDGDYHGTALDLQAKLESYHDSVKQKRDDAQKAMFEGTQFNDWHTKPGNEGKSFNDFIKEVNTRSALSSRNELLRGQIEMHKAQYDIARRNLDDMTSDKSTAKFSRKMIEYNKQMEADREKSDAARTADLSKMIEDKSTLSKIQKIQLNTIAGQYKDIRDKAITRSREIDAELKDLNDRLKSTIKDSLRHPIDQLNIRRKIKQLNNQKKILDARVSKYNTLFDTHNVPMEAEQPEAVEAVTGEDTGLIANDDPAPTTDTQAPPVMPNPMVPETDQVILPSDPNLSPEEAALEIESLGIPISDELMSVSSNDPIIQYHAMIAGLKPFIKDKIAELAQGLMNGDAFSLDSLNQFEQTGQLTQGQAAQLMQATKAYVDALQQELADTNTAPVIPDTPIPEIPQVMTSRIADPDTPFIDNSDTQSAGTIPESPLYHVGYKLVDAATTGATSTIGFEEGTGKDKLGNTIYRKVTKPNELNPDLNEDILKTGKLLPGHQLHAVVDTEYDGPKNISDSLSWDKNGNVNQERDIAAIYLDEKGKVRPQDHYVNNVPIKIVDAATGKLIMHLHKMDYIDAQFPGTKDHRNVVDTLPDGTNNYKLQRDQLMEIRKMIVDNFNNGRHTPVRIAAEGKGTGRLILNHVIENKNPDTMEIKSKIVPSLAVDRKNPEKSLLPDKKLQLVVVGEGSVLQSGKDYPFPKKVGFVPDNLIPGAVGAMVPSPNGEHMFAPLIGKRLAEEGKRSLAVDSTARAIELFLLNNGQDPKISAEINSIKSNTNFDLATATGLKGFINQYFTYSQGFNDSALSPNNPSGEKSERFVFNVDDKNMAADKTKLIKLGFTMRGDGVKYANLLNGKLDPEFIKALTEGFQTRSRAVVFTKTDLGTTGINSSHSFTDANYMPNGNWKFGEHENYNEYVKSFSNTSVYGRNQLKDGSYVYTANPAIPLDFSDSKVQAEHPVEENITPTKPVLPDIPQWKAGTDWLDDISNMSIRRTDPMLEIGTSPEGAKPLDMDSLKELYNFTPEDQRNGKTVKEALDELSSRGHTFLADGFNPFSRCL